MKEVKKIEKYSVAKISAIIHACGGFLVGLFIATTNIANILLQPGFNDSAIVVILFNIGAGFLLGALFFLAFAIAGWVVGWAIAAIYNLAAKKMGGIKIELE
jgi:hypothetical protein